MSKGWIVGIMVAVGLVLGILAFLFAQGAPTAPTIALDNALTPSATQTVNVPMSFTFQSIASPNPVWDPGQHIIYTIVQSGSNGVTNTVAAHQTTGLSILQSEGNTYTLGTTVQWSLAALCSASACIGVTENLTVTAQAVIITPYATWFSPVVTAVFNAQQGACSATAPCEPVTQSVPSGTGADVGTHTFYAELFGPLLALTGVELLAAYGLMMRHPGVLIVGAASLLAAAAILVAWW